MFPVTSFFIRRRTSSCGIVQLRRKRPCSQELGSRPSCALPMNNVMIYSPTAPSDLLHTRAGEPVMSLGLLRVLHLYSFQEREPQRGDFTLFPRHLLTRSDVWGVHEWDRAHLNPVGSLVCFKSTRLLDHHTASFCFFSLRLLIIQVSFLLSPCTGTEAHPEGQAQKRASAVTLLRDQGCKQAVPASPLE